MKKTIALCFGAVLLPSAVMAAGSNLEISIYNNNLALVRDTRTQTLLKGTNNIAFEGVASSLKPESVMIVGDEINVLEQNYNYNLITKKNILEKSIGQTVKTVTKNPKTGEDVFDQAIVLSVVGGVPTLAFDYGVDPQFDGRIIFEKLPKGLQNKPTLEAKINSRLEGPQDLSLAYLTTGISWKTNYVAQINALDRLDLTGWVTITNQSGVAYQNARVQMIAGDVNQVEPIVRPLMMKAAVSMRTSVESDSVAFASGAPEQISGYQLYTLPHKTTLQENQTKQISLIGQKNVRFTKEGRLNLPLYFNKDTKSEFKKKQPDLYYVLQNKEEDNLGFPLPAGVVRFYENDSEGRLQFIGEDSLSHLAKGETAELTLGRLFNVSVSGKIEKSEIKDEDTKTTSDGCVVHRTVRVYEASVVIKNGGTTAENIRLTQYVGDDTKLISSEPKAVSDNDRQYEWILTVAPEGEETLRFVIEKTTDERRCR